MLRPYGGQVLKASVLAKERHVAGENENPAGLDESASQEEESADVPEIETPSASLPIVGIGASAGGLEALETFFDAMPADSDMTFVIVTHQAPARVSLLPELLRNHTTMPVHEVTAGVVVEPNHIYLPPPGMHLALLNGVLQPMPADATHGVLQFPIDYFFRSLADDQKDQAICIVLSGTGTDGALGVQAVKGAGGLVMVQEEQSAKFAGMPTSAIATGVVDYVLSAAQMPRRLLSFVQGPYLQAPIAPAPLIGVTPDLLRQIHILLRNRTRQDFSAYKTSTLQRRIERRKNGEVFPIELSVTEVKVGEDVRYGAFIRDVSEKIKLQEQIIEEERLAAIGSTAAKLGHEIGNPLNGMSLATQLLELRLGELTRAFPRA